MSKDRPWPVRIALLSAALVYLVFVIVFSIVFANPWIHRAFTIDIGVQRAIQTIHQAEAQYRSQYGRYSKSLAELGPPSNGVSSSAAADLIDKTLANGVKMGYKCALKGRIGGYVITAVPHGFVIRGDRNGYSDETMVIHYENGPEPATLASPTLGVPTLASPEIK